MWFSISKNREVNIQDELFSYYDDTLSDDYIQQLINDIYYEPITIDKMVFSAGQVLYNCLSETDWRIIRNSYIDRIVEDDMFQLERYDWEDGEAPDSYINAELDEDIVWKS